MGADLEDGRYALALHGGAGSRPGRDYAPEIAHMRGLAEAARDRLEAGASALDVVVSTLVELERSGLYVAGRGASPNTEGRYELDASLMDGASGKAGAVAALDGFESPILAARAVMLATPHVLLAGDGAAVFAQSQKLRRVTDPDAWFTRAGHDESNFAPDSSRLAHGTVGCVARDVLGRLAGGTSTGGVFHKLPGRVGDTPIPGAGVWADRTVAVSCTGQGEYFLRTAAAAAVAHRIRWAGAALADATREAIDDIARLGGEGGMIAVDSRGRVSMPFASAGMKRACATSDGEVISEAF